MTQLSDERMRACHTDNPPYNCGLCFKQWCGGVQGRGDREKRGLEVYGRREKRGREAGEKGKKITQHCAIFHNRKIQEVGANKYMAGLGLKGTGSGRFKPSVPPPPPPPQWWSNMNQTNYCLCFLLGSIRQDLSVCFWSF